MNRKSGTPCIYHVHERNRTHAVRSLCVLNSLQNPFSALSDHRRWFRIDVPAREHCDQDCDTLKDPRLFLSHPDSHVALCNNDPTEISLIWVSLRDY